MENLELRRKLLYGMCEATEMITQYVRNSGVLFYGSEIPEAFKPGVADKFMFNKILDSTFETIKRDLDSGDDPTIELCGIRILSMFYWPQYGTWKRVAKRKSRRMDKIFLQETL